MTTTITGTSPRVLWITGTSLFAVMVVHLVAPAVTGGPLTGPVSLRKPATFAETGWLVCWSVALLLPLLRTGRAARAVVTSATALFAVGETAIMAVQAWRGVPSHYNFSTPLDAALVRGGAAGTAGIFLIGVVVLLVAALRSPLASSVRLGAVAGIGLLILGCALGMMMISQNSGVFRGALGSGFGDRTAAYLGPDASTVGPEYLLIRPATRGGDLVLPHAIGVHGLVLLAVPAVLLARTSIPPVRQRRVIGAIVGATATAMAVLLVHALRQLPLGQLPPLALGLLALCAATVAGGHGVIARAWVGHESGSTR